MSGTRGHPPVRASGIRRRLRLPRFGAAPKPADRAYHAFISYNRAADGHLAVAVQRGLQRFAKPWFRARALRVFRDDASLSAQPSLWSTIVEALDSSRYLILLASPESAASPWVTKEVGHWCGRDVRRPYLLIALTGGEISWSTEANDFDWSTTTALTPMLRGMFDDQPRYVDLRWARTSESLSLAYPGFRDAIADLAATIHGVPKDEIAGEEVRQHRRTVRIAWTAGVGLGLLAAAALILGIVALGEKDRAQSETRRASLQAAGAEADNVLATQPDLGLLLGLAAYRLSSIPAAQTRGVLVDALAKTRGLKALLRGHLGADEHVAFSQDGNTLVSVAEDGTARLWDVRTRRERGPPFRSGHGAVFAVALSPDGRTLALMGASVQLWDVPSRRLRTTLQVDGFDGLAFSPDGRYLAAAGIDGTVSVVDLRGDSVRRLRTTSTAGGVETLSFSGNGRLLAIGGLDGSVTLADTDGRVLRILPTNGNSRVVSVAFGPGDRLLAAGAQDASMTVWNLEQPDSAPSTLSETYLPGAGVVAVAFAPDGTLVSVTGDGVVRRRDAATGADVSAPSSLGDFAGNDGVAFDRTGSAVAAGTESGTIRIWRVGGDLDVEASQPPGKSVFAVAFQPGGQMLAASGDDERIHTWESATGRPARSWPAQSVRVLALAFSPDGSLLASGGYGGVRLWNAKTHKRVGPPLIQGAVVSALAFSPSGRLIASAGWDGYIRVWRVSDGKEMRPRMRHGTPSSHAIALSFEGERTLRSAGSTGGVRVWSLPDGRQLPSRIEHGIDASQTVAFGPDAATVAEGGVSGVIRIRRLVDGRDVVPRMAQGSRVEAATFSPDGKTLATVGFDRVVRLWDVATGLQLGTGLPNVSNSEALAFSANGETLAVAGDDGTVRLWRPLPSGSGAAAVIRSDFCRVAGRDLTQAEWRQFVPGVGYRKVCAT